MLTTVGHAGKQPTSVDGGLGSVSRISMATQITPGSRKKCHATSKSMQRPVVLNDTGPSGKRPDRETWVRV